MRVSNNHKKHISSSQHWKRSLDPAGHFAHQLQDRHSVVGVKVKSKKKRENRSFVKVSFRRPIMSHKIRFVDVSRLCARFATGEPGHGRRHLRVHDERRVAATVDASDSAREILRLLSGAICRHQVLLEHTPAHALLRFQFDHSVLVDLVDDCSRLYPPA